MCNHCCKVNCALLCIDNVFFFLQNSLEKNKMKNSKEESPRKKSGNKSISNHFFKKKREVIEKQYRHSISTWQFQTIGYIYFVWHTNPHWSFVHISYNSFKNEWCIAKKKMSISCQIFHFEEEKERTLEMRVQHTNQQTETSIRFLKII